MQRQAKSQGATCTQTLILLEFGEVRHAASTCRFLTGLSDIRNLSSGIEISLQAEHYRHLKMEVFIHHLQRPWSRADDRVDGVMTRVLIPISISQSVPTTKMDLDIPRIIYNHSR